jgi:transcriptional regulator with XRE-family HTH domain
MTDAVEFKVAMARAGVSYKDIIEELNISRYALSQKINNKSDFRQIELSKLFNLLKVDTWEKRQAIFFAHEVE